MELTKELIKQGFSIQNVTIDDLDNYISIKRACFKKYVDEYYGEWIEDIQTN